jgi:hypothetical protein
MDRPTDRPTNISKTIYPLFFKGVGGHKNIFLAIETLTKLTTDSIQRKEDHLTYYSTNMKTSVKQEGYEPEIAHLNIKTLYEGTSIIVNYKQKQI